MSLEEDFIPFQVDNDSSSSDSDSDSEDSFDPTEISPDTFHRLLACYPSTVEKVYKHKVVIKLRAKNAKEAKRARKAPSGTTVKLHDVTGMGASLTKSEENWLNEEIESYLKLDRWRYETLPALVKEKKGQLSTVETTDNVEEVDGKKDKKKGKDGKDSNNTTSTNSNSKLGLFLEKDELVRLMDWKLKHGIYRPTLAGMVKTNQGSLVRKSTSAAFSSIPTSADPVASPDKAFPKESMDALTAPLRGVGTATASLILSAGTALSDPEHEIPFYSDEMYLWLCLDDYPPTSPPVQEGKGEEDGKGNVEEEESTEKKPKKQPSKHKLANGELKVKYNLHEYRQLYGAAWELRDRLNRKAEKARTKAKEEQGEEENEHDEHNDQPISIVDIEKVAYVLAHISMSGYYNSTGEEQEQKKEMEFVEFVTELEEKEETEDTKKKVNKDKNKKRKRKENDGDETTETGQQQQRQQTDTKADANSSTSTVKKVKE